MAEGDEIGSFFHGLGAGDDGGVNYGTFRSCPAGGAEGGEGIGWEYDLGGGAGIAGGGGFFPDIDHAWVALGINVSEWVFVHGCHGW